MVTDAVLVFVMQNAAEMTFSESFYQREKYDGIKHSLIISSKDPEATTKSELKVTPA